ncbi:hypothetical protein HS088_TW11G00153 [Tripterygium wilfordii]|uniref:J domain-containing protein n=1 Tax=Tripterygium wilfordii TaxID=458696 RepID=A0A7J7D1H9_TRIWF|nr:uncharacterized protein LOC120008474 isoform X2 [Tripterygium wilfordii]KAF5740089.1 hypothetical protein HS088_TW11G00153 [Tripterygium wilfordii]
MGSEDVNRRKDNPYPPPKGPQEKAEDTKLWGVFLFGLIGATATTFALSRSQAARKGGAGQSFRTSFQEETWKRNSRRMQEEYEEEMERVERIRRMQSVFNRERNKHKRGYESWRENGTGAYHQQSQRDDWYWKADTSFRDQAHRRTDYRQMPRESASYMLSHHYLVLGLDRTRKKPYSEAEIKTAFRAKAKEFHPDQNRDNTEAAEAKFKEVMMSYEAIKQERKDMKL